MKRTRLRSWLVIVLCALTVLLLATICHALGQSGLGEKRFNEYHEVKTGIANTRILVNLFNGNLYLSATDFSLLPTNAPSFTRTVPVSFVRSYNSLSDGTTNIGSPKWGCNIGKITFDANGDVVQLNSDMSYTTYIKNSDGTYQIPGGEDKRFFPDTDYKVITKDQVTTYYSRLYGGREYIIADRCGGRVSISYDTSIQGVLGKPVAVQDWPGARRLTLEWEPGVTTSYRIKSVTDNAGRQVRYSYDLSDRLVGVTDPGGHEIRYAYDAHSNLIGITDTEGNLVSFVSGGGKIPNIGG